MIMIMIVIVVVDFQRSLYPADVHTYSDLLKV